MAATNQDDTMAIHACQLVFCGRSLDHKGRRACSASAEMRFSPAAIQQPSTLESGVIALARQHEPSSVYQSWPPGVSHTEVTVMLWRLPSRLAAGVETMERLLTNRVCEVLRRLRAGESERRIGKCQNAAISVRAMCGNRVLGMVAIAYHPSTWRNGTVKVRSWLVTQRER
jgi:hypothetical protein